MFQIRHFFGTHWYLVCLIAILGSLPKAALAEDNQGATKPQDAREAPATRRPTSRPSKPRPAAKRRAAPPRTRPRPAVKQPEISPDIQPIIRDTPAPAARRPTAPVVRRPASMRPAPRTADKRSLQERATEAQMQGLKQLQAKDWPKAEASFGRALELTSERWEKAKAKGQTRRQHYLTLARCDLLYWLSRVADKSQQPRKVCRHLHQIHEGVQTLPAGWQKWSIHPKLIERQQAAIKLYGGCTKVTTRLTWKGLPDNATLYVYQAAQKGEKEKWIKQAMPLETPGGQTLRLRLQAPGYKPLEKQLEVPRWEEKELSWPMTKLPPPVVRRRAEPVRVVVPPPRPRVKPPSKGLPTWAWIAIGAGAGVIVTTTIVIAAVAATRGVDEVEPVVRIGGATP